jgi:tetratricopeptide (TPR) repeat protein
LSASSIFDVQDEITEQVVATIAGSFGVISRRQFSEIKEKPTEHLDAYEWVLKAGAYYRGGYTLLEHGELRDGLERVVQSDPAYAEAWATLSVLYLDEYRFNLNPRPNPLDRALDAARRAVASDATSQLAHQALATAYFYRHEIDAFLPEAERAIALNPNNVDALASLGALLRHLDDERGVVLARKAAELDPFHPTWLNFTFAHHHFERGEYEAALAAAQRISRPGYFWSYIYLAGIYAELGRSTEAKSAVEELLRVNPGFALDNLIEEMQKWNYRDESIGRWVTALRKAGLPG